MTRSKYPRISRSLLHPHLDSVKMAYRNPKTDLTRGVSQKKLASEGYRAFESLWDRSARVTSDRAELKGTN